ncbi:MAG: DNA-3-methyladenine glycosylase 2 family protein [Acidimicrobiia bacterium]|nr:DNA-3-methyladenine glycosylase 2 family protein [Acidimicrobiia bacterium]
MLDHLVVPPLPVDLTPTLRPFRHGPHDPCVRLADREAWRATRTPRGPATTRLEHTDEGIRVRAWGPGAAWAVEAAPALLGFHDDPGGFAPDHPLVARLHRRMPGLRIGRSAAVVEALVATVLGQRVTSAQAHRSHGHLVRRFGEPAPGPADLWLPPEPATLAALPSWEYHRCGVERRRADTIRHVCSRSGPVDRLAERPAAEVHEALLSLPGVGPWTASKVVHAALGDPDAVTVGDWNLPGHVAWALAGERRADDARMLELLEPFRGQRARVARLLQAGHRPPPRRAPGLPAPDLARI